MKTVGAMLKEKRISKGLTVSDVEKAIKIREKFIFAMEKDAFFELPSPSYAKGFVHNYAEYLGLPTDVILAFFRRQTTEAPKATLLPKGVADPLNAPLFRLTPSTFVTILISCVVFLFVVYLGGQYLRIRQPPSLAVDSPIEHSISKEQHIAVEGRTDQDATVMINGVSTVVRDDGRFYDQVALDSGVNRITVVATSRFGKTTSLTREVGYQP